MQRPVHSLSLFASLLLSWACAVEVPVPSGDQLADDEVKLDEDKVVRGREVPISFRPWQVSVQSRSGHLCGGVIVGSKWVVTAQHCVVARTAETLQVVAGRTLISSTSGQVRSVSAVHLYPGFEAEWYGKDVALLRLNEAFLLNDEVRVIALASEEDTVEAESSSAQAAVSGWGITETERPSDKLLLTEGTVVTPANAHFHWGPNYVSEDQIGVHFENTGSCRGDSGGPLTISTDEGTRLLGLVSWSAPECVSEKPIMFARIAAFASWMRSVAGGELGPPSEEPRFLAGRRGSFLFRNYVVPEDSKRLVIQSLGGRGDADLYVQYRRDPSKQDYRCRSNGITNIETCVIERPTAGPWHIGVYGYREYSGVSLNVYVERSSVTFAAE